MAYVPQEAIDIFSRSDVPRWEDVFNAGILNNEGTPCSERTAQRWLLYYKRGQVALGSNIATSEEKVGTSESGQNLVVEAQSAIIRTLPQLIEACEVDLNLWETERWEVHPFQAMRKDIHKDLRYVDGKATGIIKDLGKATVVTMYSIKAWFKRREEAPVESAVEKLLERLSKASPKVTLIFPKGPIGEFVFVPVFTDTHFGRKSNVIDYSPARTARDMKAANQELLNRVAGMNLNLHRILFPAANDGLNADSKKNETTRGTWQEMSSSMEEAIDAAVDAYIEIIESWTQFAPVDVPIIPGNHDRLGSYWLGKVLAKYFHNNKNVHIDNEVGPRKYKHYGQNLIGMEHGDRVKPERLVTLMAEEAKTVWSQTKYRTWFRGHFHVEKEMYHVVNGVGRVSIITFPAFCPMDEWESIMGYMGGHRSAEGRLFHLEHGPFGNFRVFVEEVSAD